MSSTSFHTSLSLKNMKSTADAGKRRNSFRARVRCNAQFATMSSCARHFFKHFNFIFRRTIRYTEEWWISVSHEIWRMVLWLFGAPSRLINSLTESTLSSVRTLQGRPLPGRLLVLPVFSILLTYSGQEPPNLRQEILVQVFITIILEFLQIFNKKMRSSTLYTIFTL